MARRGNQAGREPTISGRVADGRLATLHGPARSCFGDKTRPVGAGSQPGRSRALNSDQHGSDCCGGTSNKWSRSDPANIRRHPPGRSAFRAGSRAAAVETGRGERTADSGQRSVVSGQQSGGTCTSTFRCAMALGFSLFLFRFSFLPPSFFYFAQNARPAVLTPRRHHPHPHPHPTPHPRNTADGMCEAGCSVDAVCLMRGRIGRARCPIAGKGFCNLWWDQPCGCRVPDLRQCPDQNLTQQFPSFAFLFFFVFV